MNLEAETSLYPLGDADLSHPVEDFVQVLRAEGCTVEVGPMSSIVTGESSQVFRALGAAYEKAAKQGGCLLIIKACNVCPI